MLLSGCVNDSYEDCEKVTLIRLTHEYRGDVTENVLRQHLNFSSVYIYDENENLVDRVAVSRDGLIFGSTLAALPGGRYRLVSWANAGKNTLAEYTNLKPIARIKNISSLGELTLDTSDKLYYASKEILVPQNSSYTPNEMSAHLTYESAHINFKVVVRGKKGTDIEVSFKNLMPMYDFDFHALKPYETTYYPLLIDETLEEGGYKRLLEFSTFRFRNQNAVTIELREKTTNVLLSEAISLSDLMQKNGITVEDKQEVNILLEFSLESGKVHVQIKDWKEDEVIPGN